MFLGLNQFPVSAKVDPHNGLGFKTPPMRSIPVLDGRSTTVLSGANEGIHKTYLFQKLLKKTSFLPFHVLKDVCILLLMAHGLSTIQSHHCCPITHLSDLSMTVSVIWRAHVIRLAPSLLSKIISNLTSLQWLL